MRKLIIGVLSILLVLTAFVGCGNALEASGGETKPPVEETPAETEPPVEETPAETELPVVETQLPQESQTQEEPQEQLVAPIEIDTEVSIQKGARIAVVAKATDGAFWKSIKSNMEEAVNYMNQVYGFEGKDKITMTFEGPSTEEDVTAQINIIDAVLAENPEVVCLAAIDMESCQAQLETAAENGIPVIMFDSDVTSDLAVAFCGTDNRKAGRRAADKLCKAIGNQGTVAVLAHENYTQTSKERVAGFKNRLKKKHPEVTLHSIIYKNEEETLENILEHLIEENQDLTGIFCTSGPVAEVALEVLGKYPDRDIKLVGFDMGDKQKKAIEEGIEYGAIVQNTYEIAYETIWTALKFTDTSQESLESEEKIYADFIWVDKTSLEKEDYTKIF